MLIRDADISELKLILSLYNIVFPYTSISCIVALLYNCTSSAVCGLLLWQAHTVWPSQQGSLRSELVLSTSYYTGLPFFFLSCCVNQMNLSVIRGAWANQWINYSSNNSSSSNRPVAVLERIWKQEHFPLRFTVPIVRTMLSSQLIKCQVRAVKYRNWKMLVLSSNADSMEKCT